MAARSGGARSGDDLSAPPPADVVSLCEDSGIGLTHNDGNDEVLVQPRAPQPAGRAASGAGVKWQCVGARGCQARAHSLLFAACIKRRATR
jgi:hypothetical protein